MESLSDPLKDRHVKSVKPPPHRPLFPQLMFPEKLKGKPDWKLIRDHLQKEGKISKEELIRLINEANKIFRNDGNLLYVQDPVTVVGDIHGQFYDLLKILEVGGSVEITKYLFLGDFVDRGSFSLEICFPHTIFFLRGNHECRQMTSFFNFREECLYKYDQQIYDILMDSFDLIPLACLINGKFLALHGGISPELKTMDDLKKIDRFKEPPRQGIFCDVLWSDPVDNDDGICETPFKSNEVRGCSYFFGLAAINKFLKYNNLLSVIRAHEAQIEGYKMHRWGGNAEFPSVITIFSAPNYCDVYNNKAAVIKFENNTLNIQQFNYTAHPYLLPQFMDIFTWSMPFVSEKVNEMMMNILKKGENDDNDDDEDEEEVQDNKVAKIENIKQPKKADILRNKIKFVSKMALWQKNLRENNEQIVKLKGMCPDNKIPKGIITSGENAIKDAIMSFKKAKEADLINEKMPVFADPKKR